MRPMLTQYLNDHGLPAVKHGNSIITRSEYVDFSGVKHSTPISIAATWKAVREFLGY
jgi:hypothetical protein